MIVLRQNKYSIKSDAARRYFRMNERRLADRSRELSDRYNLGSKAVLAGMGLGAAGIYALINSGSSDNNYD